ncbi:hypothetical protein PXH80_33765, partial [Mycolicibacterium smegmatis]|nr:hypothetical protein [Mycolicibacterium smegmatis]
DAFTAEDLLDGAKTAIIIHEKADNFANIPPERYQQVNGAPGPGRRFRLGLLGRLGGCGRRRTGNGRLIRGVVVGTQCLESDQ